MCAPRRHHGTIPLTAIPLSFSEKRRFHLKTHCIMMAPFLTPENWGIDCCSANCKSAATSHPRNLAPTVLHLEYHQFSVLARNVDVCRIRGDGRYLVLGYRYQLKHIEHFDRHSERRVFSNGCVSSFRINKQCSTGYSSQQNHVPSVPPCTLVITSPRRRHSSDRGRGPPRCRTSRRAKTAARAAPGRTRRPHRARTA